MATSRQRTNLDSEPIEITPACCCCSYWIGAVICSLVVNLIMFFLLLQTDCYLDLFAESVSVTNISTTTADWSIGLVAKSPVSECKIALHTIKSRLIYEDKVISQFSAGVDIVPGQLFASNTRQVDFNTVVIKPGVVGSSGGVVWGFRVETIAQIESYSGHGYVDVNCGDIPVNFTADPTGNMTKGSLLGNMIRCDYLYRENLYFSN